MSPDNHNTTSNEKERIEDTLYSDEFTEYIHSPESYAYAQEAHESNEEAFSEEESQPEAEAREHFSLRDLRHIELPTAINRRVWMQYFAAVGILLFNLFLTIFYKEPRYLIGVLISGALIYLGITTKLEFAQGFIMEVTVFCANVNEVSFRNQTSVTFRTTGELPTYLEFRLPGKQAKKFQLNALYVIYFNVKRPNILLAHIQV